jgi:uncharacterized protein (DUF983 family)
MGKFITAIQLKCPQCGKGELYGDAGILPQKGMFNMLANCSNCGLKYEKELGFFYGAMYISYGLNIGLFVIFTAAYYAFFENTFDWRWYIIFYVGFTFLLTKMIFRLSRSLWLMTMISFEPKKNGQNQ